jgi:hypothetical protein
MSMPRKANHSISTCVANRRRCSPVNSGSCVHEAVGAKAPFLDAHQNKDTILCLVRLLARQAATEMLREARSTIRVSNDEY